MYYVSCRNPIGRTGMIGRGCLGRWGPNHAADPIVTRWKRDGDGKVVMVGGKPKLEFVAIKRKDTGDWAIPGVRAGNEGARTWGSRKGDGSVWEFMEMGQGLGKDKRVQEGRERTGRWR